jgi:hypothetical protein
MTIIKFHCAIYCTVYGTAGRMEKVGNAQYIRKWLWCKGHLCWLSGVVVNMLAIGPKVHGFKLSRDDGFF